MEKKTTQEVQEEIIDKISEKVNSYIDNKQLTEAEKLRGLAYSILNIFDGLTGLNYTFNIKISCPNNRHYVNNMTISNDIKLSSLLVNKLKGTK